MTQSAQPHSETALSICIATYNRGRYITETLSSIVHQIDQRVELIVVDGASIDDTRARVEEIQKHCPQLRYFRESENSGVDADFDKAVGYAVGRYVWLMTDDDLLVPTAVEKVLSTIAHGDDLVVVNSEVGNADFSTVLNSRLLPINADARYSAQQREQFFVDATQCLTFIGGTVVKRELWMCRDRNKYYGSLFIHVGVIFQSPSLDTARIIADPLIRIRYGNAMWTPRSFEIWMFKWPSLIWSFPDYTDVSKSRVTPREPWRSPMKLFQYRSKNAYTIEEHRKFLAGLSGWRYRVISLTISVFPVFLANILSLVYLSMRGGGNLTPVYDLINNQPLVPLRRWLQRMYKF